MAHGFWLMGLFTAVITLGLPVYGSEVPEEESGHLLHVGLADVDVTPPIGVPLGGFGGGARRRKLNELRPHPYATFMTPSTGVRDPIRAKAMVLKRGEKKLLFISLDLVGITGKFRADLARRFDVLGFGSNDVFISATHTHSGPGTLSDEMFWQLLAMDRYKASVYRRFSEGVVEAARRAVEALEPAALYATQFDAVGLQQNRRKVGAPVDRQAGLLLAWGLSGRWLGGIVNFALHGTILGIGNLEFSADAPGGIERAMESELARINGGPAREVGRPTVLFVNGAEGDVTPYHGDVTGIERTGIEFAEQALAALPQARWIKPVWKVRQAAVDLGGAKFNLLACAEGKQRKFVNKHININISRMLPRTADIWQLELGGGLSPLLRILTWPGEPTTSIGLALKQLAKQDQSGSTPWVFGLTNGHLAYFTSPEEFRRGGYEACSTLYGGNAALKILSGHKKLLR